MKWPQKFVWLIARLLMNNFAFLVIMVWQSSGYSRQKCTYVYICSFITYFIIKCSTYITKTDTSFSILEYFRKMSVSVRKRKSCDSNASLQTGSIVINIYHVLPAYCTVLSCTKLL